MPQLPKLYVALGAATICAVIVGLRYLYRHWASSRPAEPSSQGEKPATEPLLGAVRDEPQERVESPRAAVAPRVAQFTTTEHGFAAAEGDAPPTTTVIHVQVGSEVPLGNTAFLPLSPARPESSNVPRTPPPTPTTGSIMDELPLTRRRLKRQNSLPPPTPPTTPIFSNVDPNKESRERFNSLAIRLESALQEGEFDRPRESLTGEMPLLDLPGWQRARSVSGDGGPGSTPRNSVNLATHNKSREANVSQPPRLRPASNARNVSVLRTLQRTGPGESPSGSEDTDEFAEWNLLDKGNGHPDYSPVPPRLIPPSRAPSEELPDAYHLVPGEPMRQSSVHFNDALLRNISGDSILSPVSAPSLGSISESRLRMDPLANSLSDSRLRPEPLGSSLSESRLRATDSLSRNTSTSSESRPRRDSATGRPNESSPQSGESSSTPPTTLRRLRPSADSFNESRPRISSTSSDSQDGQPLTGRLRSADSLSRATSSEPPQSTENEGKTLNIPSQSRLRNADSFGRSSTSNTQNTQNNTQNNAQTAENEGLQNTSRNTNSAPGPLSYAAAAASGSGLQSAGPGSLTDPQPRSNSNSREPSEKEFHSRPSSMDSEVEGGTRTPSGGSELEKQTAPESLPLQPSEARNTDSTTNNLESSSTNTTTNATTATTAAATPTTLPPSDSLPLKSSGKPVQTQTRQDRLRKADPAGSPLQRPVSSRATTIKSESDPQKKD